ncbi:GNAT family N-acetyltransferase [Erythrobacter aureus]|uniref:GNAT family N-acetyltransferase n=1 Tax=Erythrobacter aureus TaxID=2182384 RepID=UPI0013B42814|nr:GNAT family N-acetyltransferase [Erythrobacter aureus]
MAATRTGHVIAIAQVQCDGAGCLLEKLFVDPDAMGLGAGRRRFEWAASAARRMGATELIVEADPDAGSFYLAMGCAVPTEPRLDRYPDGACRALFQTWDSG